MGLLAPSMAHAAESAEGLAAKKRAAKTACLAGDYAKGVALLAEIYVDTNNPIYIFNQGRCFQQNGRYEDAVLRFREYQRKNADAGGAPDVEAEKQIADCMSLLESQKKRAAEQKRAEAEAEAARSATPPPATAAQPPGPPTPVAETPAPVAAPLGVPALSPDDLPMPVQKKLGYGALIVGGLGIAVGITAYFLARSYLQSASDLGCNSNSCVGPGRSQYDNASTAVTVSNVASIAGGVLAVGGLVLILTTPSAAPRAGGVALVPRVGPDSAQLSLIGTF